MQSTTFWIIWSLFILRFMEVIADDDHIDLPAILAVRIVPPPKWKSSESQLAEARARKALLAKDRTIKQQQEQHAKATADLKSVISALPGASRILGLPTSGTAVGRCKYVRPDMFRFIVLACHLPLSCKLNVGVNRARLLLTARCILLLRQIRGLQQLLDNATWWHARVRSHDMFWTSAAYSHEWDETSSQFKYFGSKSLSNRMGVHIQVMQQRGAFTVTLDSKSLNKSSDFCEQWLCPPCTVVGTKASDLLPALVKHMPEQFEITGNPQKIMKGVSSFSSWTFCPIGDGASGNISILKGWGHLVESCISIAMPRCLYLPDTCQAHPHQRARLAVRGLQRHSARQFSMGKLLRSERIRVNRYNPTSQFSHTHSETRQLVKRAYHNHRWLAWLHHCC